MFRIFSYSIKFKILLSTLVLFSLLISITVYVLVSSLTDEAEKTAAENISTMLSVSNDNFETSLKDINNIVLSTLYTSGNSINESIMNVLTGKNIGNDIDLIKYRRDAQDYLINLGKFKHYLKGLAIYDLSGNSLTYGLTSSFETIKAQPWYENILNSNGSEVFVPPHYYNNWLKSDEDKVFSIARLIYDEKKVVGFVIADIKYTMFNDMFSKNNANSYTLFIIDNNNGNLIFMPQTSSLTSSSEDPELMELSKEFIAKDGKFFTNLNDKQQLVVYHMSDFTKWTIVGFVSKSSIMKNFIIARNKVLVISAVFCSVAFLVYFVITSLLTRNISKLHRAIKKIDKHNLNIDVKIKTKDEIGQLYHQFEFMVVRIKELIDEIRISETTKRQAEIRALQAQINPHFLYNTLNTIKFLSILQGSSNIKTVAEALSTMLHVNMDNRNFIRIEEEIEYIQSYLSIQEYRYSNKFTFNFIVDDTLKDHMIPKLLLQPIVENALQHGIAPLKEQGIIQLKVYKEDQVLKIRVKDNGVGMSEEDIKKVLETNTPSEHIGTSNVQWRIKKIFGNDYGISIFSENSLYTIVEITIPLFSKEAINQYV